MHLRKSGLSVTALIAVNLMVLGTFQFQSAVAENISDEQFAVQPPPGVGYTGYLVNNTRSLVRFSSFLVNFKTTGGKITGVVPCNNLRKCPTNFGAQYTDVNLSLCENNADTKGNDGDVNCVRGIKTKNLLTNKESTKFIPRPELTADFNSIVKGDRTQGLPNGGNPLVVSIPSAPHEGGTLYLVKTDFYAMRNSINEPFKLDLITSGIYPVKIERGNFQPGGANLTPANYVGQVLAARDRATEPPYIGGSAPDAQCLMATKKICIVPQAFPENTAFGLTLRLQKGFTSWLYGRMANPLISVVKPGAANPDNMLVNIFAEPVKVPVPYGWIKNSELPPSLLEKYSQDRSGTFYAGKNRAAPLDSVSILKGLSNNFGASAIDELLGWMPLLGDKAEAMPSQWSFQTLILDSSTASEISKCTNQTKGLTGLIFTNATVYSSGAPTYDANSGSLDYQVAAPHFKPDGSLMAGSYDLVLNSDVARCLYGFTQAPVGASVSVTSNDGIDQVATVIVSEKDGFLRLGAYGFGFSAPKIKIKLNQPKAIKK